MNDEKLFTLAEANALIPRIAMIVGAMQRLGLQIRQEMERLADHSGQCAHDLTIAQLLRRKSELYPLFKELSRSIQQIERVGGIFKGLDLGLVDFPAKMSGEIVELCWQYGEKEIAYYHHRAEGFAGRRPVRRQQPGSRASYH